MKKEQDKAIKILHDFSNDMIQEKRKKLQIVKSEKNVNDDNFPGIIYIPAMYNFNYGFNSRTFGYE